MPQHEITIESRRRKLATIEQAYPTAQIIDVTSRADQPWVRFSPFYPHGGIPVPNSPNVTAQSVEGVWQGLKVFQRQGIDITKFNITSMKGIKRSTRSRGSVLGHQFGVDAEDLLDYQTSRIRIYLPTYRFILDHRLTNEIAQLRGILAGGRLVLLDYETNSDISDLSKPLSHASLIAAYLNDQWPSTNAL